MGRKFGGGGFHRIGLHNWLSLGIPEMLKAPQYHGHRRGEVSENCAKGHIPDTVRGIYAYTHCPDEVRERVGGPAGERESSI